MEYMALWGDLWRCFRMFLARLFFEIIICLKKNYTLGITLGLICPL